MKYAIIRPEENEIRTGDSVHLACRAYKKSSIGKKTAGEAGRSFGNA